MRKILDLITDEMVKAFEAAGLDAKYAKVTVSNRPDLCEYQCNGAMAAAKEYKKAPIMIAEEVVAQLKDNAMFESVEAVKPGFLNLKLNNEFVASYISNLCGCHGIFYIGFPFLLWNLLKFCYKQKIFFHRHIHV